MDIDDAIAAGAAAHHGLVTFHEARAHGLSSDQIQHRARSRKWRRVHQGVFAVAGAPETWEQHVLAAVLAAGEGAIASHATAAALWALHDAIRERTIEITVPRPRLPRLTGVTVHRSALLAHDDFAIAEEIRLTSVARTLVDLTAVRGLGWIARAMDDALRRNLTSLPAVRDCARRLGGAPGRRPSVVHLLVAERFDAGGGKTESWLERMVLGVLRDAGIPEPEPQYDVMADGHRYRLDFAWPHQRVAVEVDGYGPHSSYAAFHDDRQRDLRLQRDGWRVLHVSNETPASQIIDSVTVALVR